jgi:hypothetical protein
MHEHHLAADLLQRLESALSDTYTIERELGGGGMSRVFVAEERTLGRRGARLRARAWHRAS